MPKWVSQNCFPSSFCKISQNMNANFAWRQNFAKSDKKNCQNEFHKTVFLRSFTKFREIWMTILVGRKILQNLAKSHKKSLKWVSQNCFPSFFREILIPFMILLNFTKKVWKFCLNVFHKNFDSTYELLTWNFRSHRCLQSVKISDQ